MADYTKLNADNAAMTAALTEMSAKLDAYLAKQAPPVDEQPNVDVAAAAVEQNAATLAAIAAKIPA